MYKIKKFVKKKMETFGCALKTKNKNKEKLKKH